MDDAVRKGTTEALFRDVNERISETARDFDAGQTEFVCECADPTCTHRLEVPLDAYEHVREDGTRFLLAPGHEQPEIERVVEKRARFWVVEKVPRTVRETVRHLDPRRRGRGRRA